MVFFFHFSACALVVKPFLCDLFSAPQSDRIRPLTKLEGFHEVKILNLNLSLTVEESTATAGSPGNFQCSLLSERAEKH